MKSFWFPIQMWRETKPFPSLVPAISESEHHRCRDSNYCSHLGRFLPIGSAPQILRPTGLLISGAAAAAAAMAKKPPPGQEFKSPLPGQRSISSMFSKAGRSGHGRSVPLLEFLDRKSEKRGSLQGCVVDAGLTLAVRERLGHGTRRSTEKEIDVGCSATSRGEEIAESSCSGSMQEKFFRLATENVHLQRKDASINFIDLTDDESPTDEEFETAVDLLEEISDINRKRKRSHVDETMTREICPICHNYFPREMLQAHVDSELDAMETSQTDSVSQEQASGTVEDQEPPTRPRKSVLVLGDEPRHRRRKAETSKRPSSTFNHYADGGGWWDEGGVGVDAEAVGSASVWEGLGSMSFGGML